MTRTWVLALLAIAGCDRAPTLVQPAPEKPAPTNQWTCVADGDCMNSCKLGAVNKAWYASANVAECHDGCANQLAAPPRCIEGSCVAFQSDPHDSTKLTRSEHCTKKK